MESFFEKSPFDELIDHEYNNNIVKFCSFICILKNKKMNYPTVFVTVLQNDDYFNLYKELCGFDNDTDAVRSFLRFDDSIIKSKFIKRILKNDRFRKKNI